MNYSELMNQIHKAANERHMLYRAAAKGGLSPAQTQRLHELNNQLPVLWDEYRRELASGYRPQKAVTETRAAA